MTRRQNRETREWEKNLNLCVSDFRFPYLCVSIVSRGKWLGSLTNFFCSMFLFAFLALDPAQTQWVIISARGTNQ